MKKIKEYDLSEPSGYSSIYNTEIRIKRAWRHKELSENGFHKLRAYLMQINKVKKFDRFKFYTNDYTSREWILKTKVGDIGYRLVYNDNTDEMQGNLYDYLVKEHPADMETLDVYYVQSSKFYEIFMSIMLVILIIIVGVILSVVGIGLWIISLYLGGMAAAFLWNIYWYRKKSSWGYIILSPWLSWLYFIS